MFQYSWSGQPIAQHDYQTFYNSFVHNMREYKLGDVFYVRHEEDRDRMSFLEIYLLWEMKYDMFLSARVYYFAEDTQDGKFDVHSKDEVVCLCSEIVLHCEDFVRHLANTELESKDLAPLKIVSYNSYCRCVGMRRRLGSKIEEYTSHPMFGALGGIDPQYRVLYCKHTTSDADIFALWKSLQMFHKDQPDFRLEKRKRLKLSESTDDEFMLHLCTFLQDIGTTLNKIPSIGNRQVSLRTLFECVLRYGGYGGVCMRRMWRKVFLEIGGSTEYTGATTSTRKIYERFLLPYEMYLRKGLMQPANSTTNENIEVDVETVSSEETASVNSATQKAYRTSWVPSSLLSNITDIKLPYNFVASEATPDELDMLIKRLSEDVERKNSAPSFHLTLPQLQTTSEQTVNSFQRSIPVINHNSRVFGENHVAKTAPGVNTLQLTNDILRSLTREQLIELIDRSTGLPDS